MSTVAGQPGWHYTEAAHIELNDRIYRLERWHNDDGRYCLELVKQGEVVWSEGGTRQETTA
jgi:hypothetical protein